MQAAISSVQELFGKSGYRCYADALNRHPITFHSAISDPHSRVGSLVNVSCDLLKAAKAVGVDPYQLLGDARDANFNSYDDRAGLEYALEESIGIDALPLLAAVVPMAMRDIRHAVRKSSARHHTHFRMIATTALSLKRRGIPAKEIVLARMKDREAGLFDG